VVTIKLPKDAQGLAAATVGRPDDNIVVVTNRGKAKYMRVGLAPQGGRSTKGDYIISMTRVNEAVSGVVRFEPRIAPAMNDAGQVETTTAGDDGEETP
jgi:DNA gyrase/topoisomerase IV subunit A